ncbi:16S rRNA (guanine(966)-N(2))-methyltransferase RsmD [Synechococcales cyanobacterium C]|uniref:16S rRNA (Guanine(966)-N(2))-methyltransferase RsmD n=2 Tax=Petrachloros TaxID=2918834 RepID=A0A8K2A8P2_9CYAN|nr:16S rRNA (guanine(966)-N(2))-methyltransferase RsmD [Petrachloros mirabilis]NCJ08254.1 16S rRNA (guanine(966)-N(2))-methyltransferase RsmD [Petrachloros mirabilis ULC683]
MRIYGNRQIKTLPGLETRPTAARVREAVFYRWGDAIADCRWLDLCCGSGAMGAEALCRGAAVVIGIEQSRRACALIHQNWQRVAQPQQTFEIYCIDVVRSLAKLRRQTFDRIYFDPPYASPLYTPVLSGIAQFQLLAPAGELAIEHDPKRPLSIDLDQFSPVLHKTHGSTALMLLQKSKR